MAASDERVGPAPPEIPPSGPATFPTGWRSLVVDLRPLRRHRDLRLVALSRGVSFLGSMATYVAIPYQVYALTHSSLAVGLLGIAELIALLALAFLGGALADAADRRRLVIGGEAALLVCALALGANALRGHPARWPLFVLAALMAGLGALQRPALDALVPTLVDDDEQAATAAFSALEGTIAMIAGPAVAGLLIAGPGVATCFAFDAATFALSLAALAAVRAAPPPEGAERVSIGRVVEGLRYARSRQDLIGTYAVDIVAMVLGMPTALFPAIAARYGGAGALGALYAAPSVGAFVATATSGWTGRVHRHGRAIIASACVWGMAITVFGLSRWLWLALAGLALAGGADMVSGIFRMTMWNSTIPVALRGRLASIEMVSYSSGPLLGNTEAGVAASLFGVQASVVSGGVLCVVGVLATALVLPRFRHYDARS